MMPFEVKLQDWIQAKGLFEGIDRVLLAVSGGADSVAMVDALHRLRQAGHLQCEFVIGHVNHGLRGADSDADEVFVTELARQLGINVVAASVSVNDYAQQKKLSIETAGRTLRLKALAAMAQQHHCDAIATAHHKDDQAETIIHRLMRGTGFRGLCGIRPVSEVYGTEFIRPMLGMRRSDIIEYCDENNLSWREDVSNKNVNFMRNRIRHYILPELQAESNTIIDRLSALSCKSRQFLLWTEKHAQSILAKGRMDVTKKEFVLEKDVIKDCPPWVFYEVLLGVLTKLGVGLRNYKQEHFNVMRQLIEQKKAKAEFPGGIEIVVNKATAHIQLKRQPVILSQESVMLQIGQTVEFGPWKISSKVLNRDEVDVGQFLKTKDTFVEWFDAEKIIGPIEIRNRQAGDRFWPIGAKGEKKVGRFLMDAQLEADIRQNAFVIADAEKILWLTPIRMAEAVKVTEKTTRIVEVQVGR
ncbi:MAG: tRNA lysidine(34) synthetase TilS [Phycisphaerae bacterium]|nr:tRNA lysidine(34) synthetase TilS [Phycisphaerae bacterium]